MNSQESRIYAVTPVFNRIEQTLLCIECLKQQTHPNVRIIVVDGGSTDGTPEILGERYPDVTVIDNRGELWWGGATQIGIETALAEEPADSDFVLMVNNDTQFGPDTLTRLIETSRHHQAVVGAVVLGSDNAEEVIDGGITLDWRYYSFSTVKQLPADTELKLDCDVLPGRCTLVPVDAIRRCGNVDGAAFPHYLADYEFTHRLKRRGGFPLIVDYKAPVFTRVGQESQDNRSIGLAERWRNASDRRSKSNFLDHLRFVWRHSPPPYRGRLVLRLFLGGTAFLWHPVYRALVVPARCLFIFPLYRLMKRTKLLGPGTVTEDDCRRFGLSTQDLCNREILEPSGCRGHFRFREGRRSIRQHAPEALPLYWQTWKPLFKIQRFWSSRAAKRVESGLDRGPLRTRGKN